MNKPVSTITKVVGAASLVLAGYALLTSLSDIRRYIRITRM